MSFEVRVDGDIHHFLDVDQPPLAFCPLNIRRYCSLPALICAFACLRNSSGALSKRGDLLGELFGEACRSFINETIRLNRKPVKIRPRSAFELLHLSLGVLDERAGLGKGGTSTLFEGGEVFGFLGRCPKQSLCRSNCLL